MYKNFTEYFVAKIIEHLEENHDIEYHEEKIRLIKEKKKREAKKLFDAKVKEIREKYEYLYVIRVCCSGYVDYTNDVKCFVSEELANKALSQYHTEYSSRMEISHMVCKIKSIQVSDELIFNL